MKNLKAYNISLNQDGIFDLQYRGKRVGIINLKEQCDAEDFLAYLLECIDEAIKLNKDIDVKIVIIKIYTATFGLRLNFYDNNELLTFKDIWFSNFDSNVECEPF